MAETATYKTRDDERGEHLRDYWPLACLVLVSAAVASAFTTALPYDTGARAWMHGFMGYFLVSFALLKLFDPKGFADGFEMYDLLAKRYRAYGYIYPWLELGLGLAYLSTFLPALTYALTFALMSFSAVGVVSALRRGLDINCPCMGSVLSVPLSTVTLTEDLGMGLMALAMLIASF